MSLDPEEPYSVAKGYVQSAYAMMTNPYRLQLPDDITLFMAFHMLCGFAAELYFKAFLAHKGYSDAQLRKPKIGRTQGCRPARRRGVEQAHARLSGSGAATTSRGYVPVQVRRDV